ncbi:MAG: tetratricopeptide repeat protein [Burkholderiales bacterium]|nr:tetratricopeptide repeat protein [Burkholderiales bacterium]
MGDGDASRRAQELYGAGEMEAARPLYEELLHRDPDNLDVAYQLGVIYGRTNHLQAASALLEQVVAMRPDSIDVLNALANVAWLQCRWRDAEQRFRRALEIQPGTVALWANLGLCLHDAGQLDRAAQALQRALEIDPGHPDALLNSAMVNIDVGQRDAGEAILQKALQIDPRFAEAHILLAQLRLQRGDFGAGWPEYEWRFRCADAQNRRDDALASWDGRADVKRNLIIYAEQGLGDQIMFTSCLPDAIARTGHCIMECDPRLLGLFARSFPQATFFPHNPKPGTGWAEVDARPDCQAHLGSLPALFRKQWADFPRHEGYLKPDPARVAYWRERLADLGTGLKIGISWRGGVPRTRHALRSIPLREWLPLLALQGHDFVSLQYGECRDEVAELASQSGIELPHWQEALDNYSETAALVGALDLVISVCTSVVHLAGALGKCAWVLVPVCPEWRYLSAGDRMPWYPAVRLFRQQTLGEWPPVIATIRDRLATIAASQPDQIDISR